jgi:hypothetical protein
LTIALSELGHAVSVSKSSLAQVKAVYSAPLHNFISEGCCYLVFRLYEWQM